MTLEGVVESLRSLNDFVAFILHFLRDGVSNVCWLVGQVWLQLPFAETRWTAWFGCGVVLVVCAVVVCVRFGGYQCHKGGMQCMFGHGTDRDQMDVMMERER